MTDGPEHAAAAGATRHDKTPLAKLAGELSNRSPWKKWLLAAFVLMAVIGVAMRAPTWLDRGDAAQSAAAPPTSSQDVHAASDDPASAPAAARGFVDPSDQRRAEQTRDRRTSTPLETDGVSADGSLPWTAHLGGWLATLGLSFAGGFVLGIFFRTFLKTMAAIAALAVVAIVALSYFQVINVDFTTMRQNYDSHAGWVGEQAHRLKDMLVGALPSMGIGAVGFFVGFARR